MSRLCSSSMIRTPIGRQSKGMGWLLCNLQSLLLLTTNSPTCWRMNRRREDRALVSLSFVRHKLNWVQFGENSRGRLYWLVVFRGFSDQYHANNGALRQEMKRVRNVFLFSYTPNFQALYYHTYRETRWNPNACRGWDDAPLGELSAGGKYD